MSGCRKETGPFPEDYKRWEAKALEFAMSAPISEKDVGRNNTIREYMRISRHLWEFDCPCDDCVTEKVLGELADG